MGLEDRELEVLHIQQQLLRSEEMNEMVCRFAGIWSWSYDIQKHLLYPGKMLREAFHFPEVMGDFPDSILKTDLVQPESQQTYADMVRRVNCGEELVEEEIRAEYADGTVHWLKYHWWVTEYENAKPRFALGYAQLCDDERRMKNRIEMEQNRHQKEDSSLLAYMISNVNQDEIIEYKEYKTERNYELKGQSLKHVFESALKQIPNENQRRILRTGHDVEKLQERYDSGVIDDSAEFQYQGEKQTIWVKVKSSLLKDPDSGELYLYEYFHNTQQKKLLEDVVAAAVNFDYERFGNIDFESGQIAMLHYIADLDNGEIEVADYTKVSTAYAYRFVLEEDQAMFLREISLENVKKQLDQSNSFEFTHRVVEEDGSVRYRKTQFSYYNRDKKKCLMTRSDVTVAVQAEEEKRKSLQKALDEAEQATLAKSEFLSRMSHEIRTPMNAIMGMTAIAKENRTDYTQVSECLDKIDMSSQYLLTLINDILEMSKIESGQMGISHAEFDFNFLMESVRTIVETLAIKHNVRYEYINHIEGDTHYMGDMMRIQQILVNIIGNAIKFTKEGGRVRFTVDVANETEQEMRFRFVIADTGIGMSQAFMEKMFKPFTQEDGGITSEHSGSGLGLAISKSLVEAMGGTICVESFAGIGSTFTVEVPVGRISSFSTHKVKTHIHKPIEEVELDGTNVLMAEDHPLNVMVATRLLERKGVSVTVAGNGQDAVEQFESSEPGYYDAILMDIRMPVMDGLTAARKIRSLDRDDASVIPIIAMTANALEEDRERSREAGMNAHLAKPFDPAELYKVLKREIGEYYRFSVDTGVKENKEDEHKTQDTCCR